MDKITIKEPYSSVGGSHEMLIEVADLSQVSDGYHTIEELYDHRITLFIALCRVYADTHYPIKTWRSKLHSDSTSINGWFIMGIGKEEGKQISYHLPVARWDETDFAETLDRAPEWDGHTSTDVLNRLKAL